MASTQKPTTLSEARVHGKPLAGPWTIWPKQTLASSRSRSSPPATMSTSSTSYKALADEYGAQLRVTRLRPSGPRRRQHGRTCSPTQPQQQSDLPTGSSLTGADVLTGDSFFHLNALGKDTGEPLPGLSMCGAGRVVCLIDPIGDVYACPLRHPRRVQGRQSVRDTGGFSHRCGAKVRPVSPNCASRSRRGRMRLLRRLRRLPRRLYGSQVLHRHTTRRTGPRMRTRPCRRGSCCGFGRWCGASAVPRPLATPSHARRQAFLI